MVYYNHKDGVNPTRKDGKHDRKRYRKLCRALFTKFYLQHRADRVDWISAAYKCTRNSTAANYAVAYAALKKALEL